MKNRRLVPILERICSSDPLVHDRSVEHLETTNSELMNNFRIYQRDNIEDFLVHLEDYFRPKMKDSMEKKTWLICEQGHAFTSASECPTCTKSPGAATSERTESSLECPVIRDVIRVVKLKNQLREMKNPTDQLLASFRRQRLESTLETALKRLAKDDVTVQQLSSLSDDDDDDEDGDDGGGGTDGGEPTATGSSDYSTSEAELLHDDIFNIFDI